MTERIVPSPIPDDEPIEPTRTPATEDEPDESDDGIDEEEPVALP